MESFKTRLSHAEERIRDLKDRPFEITQSEEQKEKKRMKKREENQWNLWDMIKKKIIHIMRMTEEEKRIVQKVYLKE